MSRIAEMLSAHGNKLSQMGEDALKRARLKKASAFTSEHPDPLLITEHLPDGTTRDIKDIEGKVA